MVNIADIEKVNLKIMTCNLPLRELFDHNELNIQILHFCSCAQKLLNLLEDGKGSLIMYKT